MAAGVRGGGKVVRRPVLGPPPPALPRSGEAAAALSALRYLHPVSYRLNCFYCIKSAHPWWNYQAPDLLSTYLSTVLLYFKIVEETPGAGR